MLAAMAAFWDQEVRRGCRNRFSYTTSVPCHASCLWSGLQQGQELEATALGKEICAQMPGKMVQIQVRARLKGWKDSARRSDSWRLSLLELAEEETELRMLANLCEMPKKMDVPSLPMIDSGSR